MSELVRWSCGCIGLATDCPTRAILIEACDATGTQGLTCFRRDMSSKSSEALSSEEIDKYVCRIEKLLWAGHRFKALSRDLRNV
jgi:hypothetical protein